MNLFTWLCLLSITIAIRVVQCLENLMSVRSSRTRYHVRVFFTADYNPETTVEYVDTRYRTARGALNRAIQDFDAHSIEVRPVTDAYYKAEFLP